SFHSQYSFVISASSTVSYSRVITYFLFSYFSVHRVLHSFPTRRSSDLVVTLGYLFVKNLDATNFVQLATDNTFSATSTFAKLRPDRKSTRLNSSHVSTSYAVFCLKKKRSRRSSCPRSRLSGAI